MNSISKILLTLRSWVDAFFGIEEQFDSPIAPAASRKEPEVVPFDGLGVPYMGKDHAALVKQAEKLFRDNVNRRKWLHAVYKVRQTQAGWILDRGNKCAPNWGVPGTATAIPG